MATFHVEVKSEATRRILARLPKITRDGLRDAVTELTQQGYDQLRKYPPRRSYQRTYRLQRSWSQAIQGRTTGTTGQVRSDGNVAPYNVKVQDADQQSPIHRGWWKNTEQATARGLAGKAGSTLQEKIERRIESLL